MNKQKELAKNTAILTVGKACTQLISFLLLPLYTALLNTEEYGIVDLLCSYTMLLLPIINWQFDNGLFRFLIDVRNDNDGKRTIFSTVFFGNILQCLVFGVLFFAFNGFIHTEYKYFLLFDAIVNVYLNLLLQFSRGLGENAKYTLGSFLAASLTVALNVIYIAVFKMGPAGMFIATVESKFIAIFYLAISNKVWRFISYRQFSRNIFKKVCSYSVPLIPNQLSWWILNTSDRTVITYFISLSAEGIYAVANKISSAYSTVSSIVYLAFSEAVSVHFNDDDSIDFINDTINSLFKLFASLLFLIVGVMPLIFKYFINAQFDEAYNHIPILLIGAFFQTLVGFYSSIYVALKKSVEIAKSTIISAVVNLVVDLLMIKSYGIFAGSVSTLVAFLVVAIYRAISIRKYIKIRLNIRDVVFCIASLAVVLPIYYIRITYISVVGLVIAIIISYLLNKNFIKFALSTLKSKFTR